LKLGYLLSGKANRSPPIPSPPGFNPKERETESSDPPPSKGAATHTKVGGREGGGRVPLSEEGSEPPPSGIKALLYVSSVESASIRARLPPQVFGPPSLEANKSSKKGNRESRTDPTDASLTATLANGQKVIEAQGTSF